MASSKKTSAKKTAAKAATAPAPAAKAVRHPITNDLTITVLKKEIPFTEGTKQHKRASAVLACKGKTVAEAKKRGADTWTVRELARRKVIRVASAA